MVTKGGYLAYLEKMIANPPPGKTLNMELEMIAELLERLKFLEAKLKVV